MNELGFGAIGLQQYSRQAGAVQRKQTVMERLKFKRESLELTIWRQQDELEAVKQTIDQLEKQPELESTLNLLSKVSIF